MSNVSPWEEAYLRFETPAEEIQKFRKRFHKLGISEWNKEAEIIDLFSGRGNGLQALSQLGFSRLEGVDYSAALAAEYKGPARYHVADCRKLPFADESKDIAVVQGGLHHLIELPKDLDTTLGEVRRVLRPEGRFVIVEPWSTPFLKFVHFVCEIGLARKMWDKLDALATMTHYERDTYFGWLGQPQMVLDVLHRHFEPVQESFELGKLFFVGKRRG